MTDTTSISPVAASGTLSPSFIESQGARVSNGSNGSFVSQESPFVVGGSSCPADTPLTDELREFEIARAGRLIERCMAKWEAFGCFAAKGDADRARLLMEKLIAGRSAAQVGRMLEAQAERMASEPGV